MFDKGTDELGLKTAVIPSRDILHSTRAENETRPEFGVGIWLFFEVSSGQMLRFGRITHAKLWIARLRLDKGCCAHWPMWGQCIYEDSR